MTSAQGDRSCPFCHGALLLPADFAALCAQVPTTVEARENAPCFARVRTCPDCRVPMVSWRIAQLESWIEKCPNCEGVWVEQADRRTIEVLARKLAREKAWSSFSAREREEMAGELAAEHVPEPQVLTPLSAGETVQAVVGMPIVGGAQGDGAPLATIGLTCVIAAFFALGLMDEAAWGFEALAWQPQQGLSIEFFTAMWAHDGWVHLMGNLFFFWAFGSAVERRERHLLLLGTFLATGLLTTWLQSLATSPGTAIGGASGAIFAVMGLAAVLQRRAHLKVTMPFVRMMRGFLTMAITVPLWLGAVGYFALQLLLWQLGVEGIGFLAHASGLVLGVLIGLLARPK